MRVLLLRAPSEISDDVDPYVQAFNESGINAEGLDVLSFHYINQNDLRQKIKHPENYGGIVFTSPRGIAAIVQSLGEERLNLTNWTSLPCYVVGEGTAKSVVKNLGLNCIGQESGSAQQLAQFICERDRQHKHTKPLLFPGADLKRNLLVDTLAENHITVDVVVSYKTVPHPEMKNFLKETFLQNNLKPDILVFFSPSGVNAVLSCIQNSGICLETCKFVAIGPTTEAALKSNNLPVFATAVSPNPSSLVDAVKKSFN